MTAVGCCHEYDSREEPSKGIFASGTACPKAAKQWHTPRHQRSCNATQPHLDPKTKKATGKRLPTAAMQAGIVDSLWTFSDLYDTVMG